MSVIWAVFLWLMVAGLGSVAYATIGMTLSHLGLPRLREEVSLRVGLALSILGLEGGWLTWAALTTGFAQGSPMNITAVCVGGPVSLFTLIAVFAGDRNLVRGATQVLWPIGLLSWLVGRMVAQSAVVAHTSVSGLSLRLADLVDQGGRRKQLRQSRIRAMEEELGISDGRLLDLPEVRQDRGRS